MSKQQRDLLLAALGARLEFDKPMAPLTTFKTGGSATYFVCCRTADELAQAVVAAANAGVDCFLLGGGSNLLVSDGGFDGLIIKADVRGLRLVENDVVEAGSGEELGSLVRFAADNSLTRLEFAAGIYGTVGGALYGNAGAYGGQIGTVVRDLTVMNRGGEIRTVAADYCGFGYRDSYLKVSREIVISARFCLRMGDRGLISREIDRILAIRGAKFPPDGRTAGCFFKNIPDPSQPFGKLPAGKLLDEVGAKALHVGGAKVYEKHANIIVNTGTASSKDISDLADILKKKVLQKFGIMLEEEVIRIGSFPT